MLRSIAASGVSFLLAYSAILWTSNASDSALPVVWTANGFAIMELMRRADCRMAAVELAFIMAVYVIAFEMPPNTCTFPLGFVITIVLSHAIEISIAVRYLLKSELSILTTAASSHFNLKDLKYLCFYAGGVGPVVSSILVLFSYLFLDSHDVSRSFSSAAEWILRHAASNVIMIWALTLLTTKVPVISACLVTPSIWIFTLRIAEFLLCLAGLVGSAYCAAYYNVTALYMVLALIVGWIAYRTSQAVNAVTQLFTYVFIVYTYFIYRYDDSLRSNAELSIIVYSTSVMSCFVSAAAFEARSMVKNIKLLLDETKSRYADLQKSKEELDLASKQSLLFAFMSHEFKTPLSIIIGFCQELEHNSLDLKAIDSVHHIGSMAEDLLQLTSEMLDMIRLRNGKSTLNLQLVDIHRLFTGAAAKMAVYGRSNNVDVVSSISPGVPRRIITDRVRLEEILHNISANAIKFSAERHGIKSDDIEEQRRPLCRMELQLLDERLREELTTNGTMVMQAAPFSGEARAPCVVVRVADEGRCIPANMHKAIFNVYERVGSSTEQVSVPGTGLGLAIVSELVGKMDGGIHVKSGSGEEGSTEGSTFSVILPALTNLSSSTSSRLDGSLHRTIRLETKSAQSSPVALMKISRSKSTGDISLHVLVVEDTPLNQKLITSILQRQGHTYEMASNGEIALELIIANEQLHRKHFDAVILDLFMPKMGGEEFLKQAQIQLPPHLAETPVVVCSADVQPEVKERLLQMQCVAAIMEKPYRPATIQKLLLECVSHGEGSVIEDAGVAESKDQRSHQ